MSDAAVGVGDDVALEIRRIGDDVGVVLPRELLDRWQVKEGDLLRVGVRGPVDARPADRLHGDALAIAREAYREYAATYHELAR